MTMGSSHIFVNTGGIGGTTTTLLGHQDSCSTNKMGNQLEDVNLTLLVRGKHEGFLGLSLISSMGALPH